MISNAFLLVFAIAFMGCVLTTPLVTRIAAWVGAIDRPDQFRRIHKGATPRMGGLGVAFGLGISILPVALGGYLHDWPGSTEWWGRQWSVILSAFIVLVIGVLDDTRGLSPRVKLMGQAGAVLVLILGGIQISRVVLLGVTVDLTQPGFALPIFGHTLRLSLPAIVVTLLWFLGCMNVWNLIDGMDGLASGVGLLVAGTMMLVTIQQGNLGSALLAAALAGSLAGFLLYNWHPAVIFLGDSGSLLIGLLIGVIGVQDSMKKASAVTILFPLLAMGLPISDTAMAIFRRWVRNLPLSSADRRHVHHLLIGMGLNPRQAALMLYCFSAFLCGVVLLGVSLNSEFLALVLGLSGCLAFLLILTSRRDELTVLWADLRTRIARGKQERQAAKITWEAIQRIELCDDIDRIWGLLHAATEDLGCDALRISCCRDGKKFYDHASVDGQGPDSWELLSGPTASFRLTSGRDLLLSISLHQRGAAPYATDIAFRFLQRLSLATAERMERLLANEAAQAAPELVLTKGLIAGPSPDTFRLGGHSGAVAQMAVPTLVTDMVTTHPRRWLRKAFGWLI